MESLTSALFKSQQPEKAVGQHSQNNLPSLAFSAVGLYEEVEEPTQPTVVMLNLSTLVRCATRFLRLLLFLALLLSSLSTFPILWTPGLRHSQESRTQLVLAGMSLVLPAATWTGKLTGNKQAINRVHVLSYQSHAFEDSFLQSEYKMSHYVGYRNASLLSYPLSS